MSVKFTKDKLTSYLETLKMTLQTSL